MHGFTYTRRTDIEIETETFGKRYSRTIPDSESPVDRKLASMHRSFTVGCGVVNSMLAGPRPELCAPAGSVLNRRSRWLLLLSRGQRSPERESSRFGVEIDGEILLGNCARLENLFSDQRQVWFSTFVGLHSVGSANDTVRNMQGSEFNGQERIFNRVIVK